MVSICQSWKGLVGLVGEAVAFDGTASRDPGGTIMSYDWDFGAVGGPFEPFPGVSQDWEPDKHCTKGASFVDFNWNLSGY